MMEMCCSGKMIKDQEVWCGRYKAELLFPPEVDSVLITAHHEVLYSCNSSAICQYIYGKKNPEWRHVFYPFWVIFNIVKTFCEKNALQRKWHNVTENLKTVTWEIRVFCGWFTVRKCWHWRLLPWLLNKHLTESFFHIFLCKIS